MMKNVFFITGFPRSRTAWLANFFTYGNSLCLHDASARGRSAAAIAKAVNEHQFTYTGVSDSGIPLFWRELEKLFPEAKWLLIERDETDALESFVRFFSKNHYLKDGKKVAFDVKTAEHLFDQMNNEISAMREAIPVQKRIAIEYTDLDSKLALEMAWKFLTPENHWCSSRYALLQTLRINTIPEKVSVTWE